jgi:two-component system, NtrC family, response regulator AtoC
MNEKILIVEDEETLRESLARVFMREGYQVVGTHEAESAMALLQDGTFDLILTDIVLPGSSGIELLKWIKDTAPDQMVIIMTAYASLETAVETLRSGAYDYVVKPIIHEEIKQIVRNALKVRALHKENILLQKQLTGYYDLSRIIAQSPEMLQIIARTKALPEPGNAVLIIGEVGTGKRLLARSIHFSGVRAERPFVTINLRAIPAELQETKLFGKAREPLSGFNRITRGLLEEANGGTVYLSGIELLPLQLQDKLGRALADWEFQPPGRAEMLKIDLTIIASTDRELDELVSAGRFHGDLYQRLQAVTFRLPPLRDRKEDLAELTQFFLRYYAGEFGKNISSVEPEVLTEFLAYHWPGNVRELRSIIERAALLASGNTINRLHLSVLTHS